MKELLVQSDALQQCMRERVSCASTSGECTRPGIHSRSCGRVLLETFEKPLLLPQVRCAHAVACNSVGGVPARCLTLNEANVL